MPIPWGEIATIGAAAGSFAMQGKQNAKNRRFSEKMADKSWHRSMDLRNWDNEYNLPQHQMERLKQAGINPLLPFIGGGSASGGQSAPAQKTPEAKHSGTAPPVGNSIESIYDLRMKKAGTDKMLEETAGLKTANDRAMVTWLEDKQYISATQAAQAAQKIAESSLRDIEVGVATGKDAYFQSVNEKEGNEFSKQPGHSTGYGQTKVDQGTIKKANSLIEANTGNVHAQNMARKALKEWLENPKGGWEALKTVLLLTLGK